MKGIELVNLVAHSARMGSDPNLVQAGGGNTSWKNGSTIFIKASGKRLIDALTEDIFAQVEYGGLSSSEIINCTDFRRFTAKDLAPSIETNFHIILQGQFVTHLHSLGSIALGVSRMEIDTFLNQPGQKSFVSVSYARPGVQLAKQIIGTVGHLDKNLILENHGVIFSAENIEGIESAVQSFEENVLSFFSTLAESENYPSWIEILTGGVLTPDEAVFLGNVPFTRSELPLPNLITIKSDGTVIFPEGISSDKVDLANFYVRVAKLIERKTQVRYITSNEVNALVNWDREKLRIAMAK